MYKLNLKEIPPEGRSYHFTEATGELNDELSDLLDGNSFDIRFFIKPVGQIYEMTGTMSTGVDEICARCGWDLNLPLQRRFHEFLIQEQEQPRNSQSVHGNQSVDFESQDLNSTTFKGEHFLVGEFFHEMIALMEPVYPSCEKSDCEHLLEAQRVLQTLENQTQNVTKGPGAFSVLKDLFKKQ